MAGFNFSSSLLIMHVIWLPDWDIDYVMNHEVIYVFRGVGMPSWFELFIFFSYSYYSYCYGYVIGMFLLYVEILISWTSVYVRVVWMIIWTVIYYSKSTWNSGKFHRKSKLYRETAVWGVNSKNTSTPEMIPTKFPINKIWFVGIFIKSVWESTQIWKKATQSDIVN